MLISMNNYLFIIINKTEKANVLAYTENCRCKHFKQVKRSYNKKCLQVRHVKGVDIKVEALIAVEVKCQRQLK